MFAQSRPALIRVAKAKLPVARDLGGVAAQGGSYSLRHLFEASPGKLQPAVYLYWHT